MRKLKGINNINKMNGKINNKIINAINVLEKDKDSKGFHIVTDIQGNKFKYNIKIEIEKITENQTRSKKKKKNKHSEETQARLDFINETIQHMSHRPF